MSIKTIHICDKCHKEIESVEAIIHFDHYTRELCKQCTKELKNWIGEPLELESLGYSEYDGVVHFRCPKCKREYNARYFYYLDNCKEKDSYTCICGTELKIPK